MNKYLEFSALKDKTISGSVSQVKGQAGTKFKMSDKVLANIGSMGFPKKT